MYPEDDYLRALGKAHYAFTYYEWEIAYVVDYLTKVREPSTSYFHGDPELNGPSISLALGAALTAVRPILDQELHDRVLEMQRRYDDVWRRRATLTEAHPFTDANAKQRLGHYAERHWTPEKLAAFVSLVEDESRVAGGISDELKALVHRRGQ